MRPIGTAAELQRRRHLAVTRLHDGYSVPEVTEFLGVSERAVQLWQAAYRKRGLAGLKAQPPPPRPGKRSTARERQVLGWFRKSPKSFGFATDLWTGRRVADVIRRKWGITFNGRYLLSGLKDRKITPQKPQRRPRKHDPAAVERWRARDGPRLRNGRDARRRPLFSSTSPGSC